MPAASQGLTRLLLTWGRRERRLLLLSPFAKAVGPSTDEDSTEQVVWNDFLFGVAGRYAVLSNTLGAATLAASATVDVSGAVSRTLASASLAATGALDITGALSRTLDGVTLVATGSLQPSEVQAALSQTLAPAALAATARVDTAAAVSATLAAASVVSAATVEVLAASSVALAPATLASAAQVALQAALSASCEATLAASGTVEVRGSVSAALEGATLAASATTASVREAALAVTLADATLSAGLQITDPVVEEPRAGGGGTVRWEDRERMEKWVLDQDPRRARLKRTLQDATLRAVATTVPVEAPATEKPVAPPRERVACTVIALEGAKCSARVVTDWADVIKDDEMLLEELMEWAA